MKSLYKIYIFVILMLYCSTSYGRLFLDVSILNKKGIDIGLTLGSELHSREEVRSTEDISLIMKSGARVLLRASYDDQAESGDNIIGPSSKVIIKGRIIEVDGQIVKDFYEHPLVVKLGETVAVTYSKDSQLIELKIKPLIE